MAFHLDKSGCTAGPEREETGGGGAEGFAIGLDAPAELVIVPQRRSRMATVSMCECECV